MLVQITPETVYELYQDLLINGIDGLSDKRLIIESACTEPK